MSERVWVDVSVDHTAILLDDVPDLHAGESKDGSKLGDVMRCDVRGEVG